METLTQKYLRLDDEILEAKTIMRNLQSTVKRLEAQQDEVKGEMLSEYELGVLPDDGLIIKKVPPKPIVIDEDKLPDRFWKVKREINKADINKAVKDGEMIEGVAMDNGGYTLAIKAKQ